MILSMKERLSEEIGMKREEEKLGESFTYLYLLGDVIHSV